MTQPEEEKKRLNKKRTSNLQDNMKKSATRITAISEGKIRKNRIGKYLKK